MTVPFHIPMQWLEIPAACAGSPHNATHSVSQCTDVRTVGMHMLSKDSCTKRYYFWDASTYQPPDYHSVHEITVPISQSPQCSWWGPVLPSMCPVHWVTISLCTHYLEGLTCFGIDPRVFQKFLTCESCTSLIPNWLHQQLFLNTLACAQHLWVQCDVM